MISLHCLLLNLIAAASSTMLINQPLKEMPLDWEPVAPTAAFAFTFDCKAIPKAQCKQARFQIRNAGIQIAKDLLIMTPISVHVWFVPLQQNKKLVPLANGTRTEILTDTLVRSITTNIAATRDGGQLLMYPRAAIRQSMQLLTSKAFYPRFDIELQFNSQWSWDFGEPGQSNVEFSRFYHWAMAGLVRGMGMTSSLTIRRNAEEVPFLTPKMFTTARNTYFEPCTAFDSILHLKDLDSETNRWEMIQLLNAVRNFTTMGPSQGPNVTDLISGISGNKQKFGLGQKLWEMVADNMLAAKLQNSYWSLWRTTYNKDSSVDFFVREPSAINGLEAFDQHNSQSGRNTAMEMEASRSRILEMIGYRTVKNSLPSNFTASTTFGTPQYNPADSKYYQDDDGEMLIRTFESVDSLGRKMVNLQSDTSAI